LHKNFADVLDLFIKFLEENPTECIVMNMQEEHTPKANGE